MKMLAMTSGKGGVGKSTLALNIARQLSLSGKRTLMVDFDIHNKGVTNLFLPLVQPTTVSVTEIIGASNGFKEALSPMFVEQMQLIPLVPGGELLFLPAARPTEMMEWQNFVAGNEEIVSFFHAALIAIAEQNRCEVVVIDCYGGIDSLTVAAAGIADDTIIVNEPDLITFGGTLTLYAYLLKKYEVSSVTARLHFVINRITARHSFKFLSGEYAKNLAQYSIDRNILAYFPYDKLLLDTFGDYPFFSELVPKGLFTRKIRLLIATLWGTEGYASFFEGAPQLRKKIFERTSEAGFAEPEAILRALVNLPFFLFIPLLLLLGLHFGVGGSLHYWTICAVLYTAGAAILLLVLTIGAFEPLQISRWLWREASYRRRKRSLKRRQSAAYRGTKTAVEFVVASVPFLVGLATVGLLGFYGYEVRKDLWNEQGRLVEISIWPVQITGFRPRGHYADLHLNSRATIEPGTDLSQVDFSGARMGGVKFNSLIMPGVNFTDADLVATEFDKTDLSGAIFNGAQFSRTSFSSLSLSQASFDSASLFNVSLINVDLSGARFPHAYLRLHLGGTNTFARGVLQSDFSEAGTIVVDGDPKLDDLKKNGAKVVMTPEDEYRAASQSKPPRLEDMIEARILQSDKDSLADAEVGLGDLAESVQESPASIRTTKMGKLLLLRLLHAEMANQPTQKLTEEWCAWIGENEKLIWNWKIWDAEMEKKQLPATLKKELLRIEDSAQNKIGVDPFCKVPAVRAGKDAAGASK